MKMNTGMGVTLADFKLECAFRRQCPQPYLLFLTLSSFFDFSMSFFSLILDSWQVFAGIKLAHEQRWAAVGCATFASSAPPQLLAVNTHSQDIGTWQEALPKHREAFGKVSQGQA